jgi:hypothetical protein
VCGKHHLLYRPDAPCSKPPTSEGCRPAPGGR